MARKKRRKEKRKSGIGRVLFFLILAGGISALFFFRQVIFDSIEPWLEKKGVMGEKRDVTLYFSDPEGEYLVGEKRGILKRPDIEEEAEEMIGELIKGSQKKLISTLPPRTELLAFQLDERGIAKVNFNKALSQNHPGGSSAEVMTVYSIVNSLTLNFLEIRRVQILVEGKEIETITGHLSLRQPLSSKPDLIKKSTKKTGP